MTTRVLEATNALISLLEELETNQQEQGIRSLGDNIGVSKSTVHRMLQNLASKFWVYQDNDSKNYYIGLRFLCFANEWKQNLRIVQIADPYLQNLAHQCGQTIVLNILNKGRALCIHKIEALSIIRIASRVGHEYPLHAGASGKTVLAYSPKSLVDETLSCNLESFGPCTITDPAILRDQLVQIRKTKYCITQEEVDPGVAAISSPVLNSDNSLAFVVTIAGTYFDIRQNEEDYLRLLLSTTSELEDIINS